MKKSFTILLAGALCVTIATASEHSIRWGYTAEGAPEHWGDLAPEFYMCKEGKNQAPIDILIDKAYATTLKPIQFHYYAASNEVLNNGHTEQVNIQSGSYIVVDGMKFELKQFHFHTPSENTINGRSFPLEAHFVHLDKEGNIAVVALMFEYGNSNKVLEKIWSVMPEKEGKKSLTLSGDDIEKLLPKDRSYYRFNGSLTTPPCSEGVRWFVLKTPVKVSREQVEKFAKIMKYPNNRPVQPINARVILK
ncbi:carbonic anhydrase [Nitratifractor sp.]